MKSASRSLVELDTDQLSVFWSHIGISPVRVLTAADPRDLEQMVLVTAFGSASEQELRVQELDWAHLDVDPSIGVVYRRRFEVTSGTWTHWASI